AAGLQEGDYVIRFQKKSVKRAATLRRLAERGTPRGTVRLTGLRGGGVRGVTPQARGGRGAWNVSALLGACLLAALPARADEPRQDVKPVTVPFELLKSRHMAVQVKVNGKGPYRVIFDTGAPVNLLNNRVAKESGVLPKDFKRPPFALFGSAGQFKIETLELGGGKAQNLPVAVMDHPTVTAMAKALGPIEGIVGFSFFARYRLTIDYQAKELTFVPTGFDPPDMMAKMMALLLAPPDKKKRVLAPAAQWGLRVTKEAGDE